MPFRGIAAFLAVLALAWPASAEEIGRAGPLVFHNPLGPCEGTCAVSVYGGAFIETDMISVFGIDGFVAPWDYDFSGNGLAAVAFSRELVTIPEWASIEAEIGLAQRFGDLDSAETWAVLYLRYSRFPWNNVIRTSVAVSTGFSYAFGLDEIEVDRSGNGGSKLMHFLSPEITLGLPQYPDVDLLLRFHHRSGGTRFFPGNEIFNDTSGGAQYLTVGFRFHF